MMGLATRFPVLIALAVSCVASPVWCGAGILVPAAARAEPADALLAAARFVGPPQPVFDTRTACEKIDIPDAPARAFRDDHDRVHLISTHYVARAMVGPSLDEVKHDCEVLYRSPRNPDPASFQDHSWLYSFYTPDGRRVAALLHSEYHAFEIPGMCRTPGETKNCWWNTITFAQSLDGGGHFTVPRAPANLVASVPYRYVVGNHAGASGFSMPTNIVKRDGFYYVLINDWPFNAQKYGPCLMRTDNVFAARSWRAWDGRQFAIRFADPYREVIATPAAHVCEPVLAGCAESLVYLPQADAFIVTQFTPDNRFGPPGLYVVASRDLIRWSKPVLVATVQEMSDEDGSGRWKYGYSSLLDPRSQDRNFSVISQTPYLYYVRFDAEHPPYARVLFRRKIAFQVAEAGRPPVSGWNAACCDVSGSSLTRDPGAAMTAVSGL